MKQVLILYPMFALVFLTLLVLGLLAFRRINAIKNKEINPRYFKLFQGYEAPDRLLAIGRNYQNLFELPVVFYVLVFSIYLLDKVDLVYLVLCWAYVALRYYHSYVHIFGNPLILRFYIFAASYCVLVLIFVRLIIKLTF